jgi:hypothetical protein
VHAKANRCRNKTCEVAFSRLTGDIDMTDNDALVELHTALIDTCNGYDEALKDAQKPDIVALFQRAKLLHEKAHANIHAILSARGVAPDDEGSFMLTVHETVISVRSAVVGLDKSLLTSFASGEQKMIGAEDKAIESNGDDGPVRIALEQQRSTLIDLVGEMQRKAA